VSSEEDSRQKDINAIDSPLLTSTFSGAVVVAGGGLGDGTCAEATLAVASKRRRRNGVAFIKFLSQSNK
jgi:hypothetical protein